MKRQAGERTGRDDQQFWLAGDVGRYRAEQRIVEFEGRIEVE